MIYTMTCNPSLDYIVTVEDFQLGKTNRTETEVMVAGGKGINVSTLLRNLGVHSVAFGFLPDDFLGKELIHKIDALGIANGFIPVSNGSTRINLKLKNIDGTEINGKGANITKEEKKALFTQVDQLQENDILILSGSIPNGISTTFYGEIMERLQEKKVIVVVDATKELLQNTLPYKPFLIKPNHHELGELFRVKLKTKKDVLPYAKKMQELGARNVLVSMAAEGAVFVSEFGDVLQTEAPDGVLVNAVGSGDSMVAGFMAGWLEKKEYLHAFKMGISAGSATAFSEGIATKKLVEEIYETLKV